MQLAHAGYRASSKLTGLLPVSPSAVEGIARSPREALSIQGIQKIVSFFAEAAARAKTAGFDGVQIHAAHGHLLCDAEWGKSAVAGHVPSTFCKIDNP